LSRSAHCVAAGRRTKIDLAVSAVPGPQERRLRDRVLPIASAPASLPDSPLDRDRNLPNSPIDTGSPVAAASQRLTGGPDAGGEGTGHGRSIRQRQDLSVAGTTV
jgi:hypothetical protein